MRKDEGTNISKGRHFTEAEREAFRQGIERKLGVKLPKRGRPVKDVTERTIPVTIRLHPKVMAWAKSESKRLDIGYQTIINEALLFYSAWAAKHPNHPLF